MRILSIDGATRTGWCFGDSRARGPAVFKAVRMRATDEGMETVAYNMGPWLRDRLREFRPDALVVENRMSTAGQKNAAAGEAQCLIHGAIYGIAGIFGVKVHNPVVGSVRTAMCGRSTGPVAASELIGLTDGQKKRLRRQRTKEMVLARCHQLGLLPADCMDFDIADAALQWGYWASRYGDREGTELYLFAE